MNESQSSSSAGNRDAQPGNLTPVSRRELLVALISIPVVLALWYLVFDAPFSRFWIKMAIATPILAAISLSQWRWGGGARSRRRMRFVIIGLATAVGLYLLFLLGNVLLTSLFPGTATSISSVYATGEGIPSWVIALLLLFVTSPAEEIYWRGFIQRIATQRCGRLAGVILTTALYTGVHVVTLNLPLVLAAFTAGLVWALTYYFEANVVPSLISHALWATTSFVILPVT